MGISSNSPIGASRDPGTVFDESSPYRPYLAYGQSKKLMEDAFNAAGRVSPRSRGHGYTTKSCRASDEPTPARCRSIGPPTTPAGSRAA